ncbi:MAG TPA: hypothetical protein VMU94_07905 [Streptosporangiaceae bacterium]|nr:hypothetical protein [Streptosporangiaceae bacterium]
MPLSWPGTASRSSREMSATRRLRPGVPGGVHEKPVERGPGFVTASVIDPSGNILGVMYNQHYLQILGSRADA